MIKVEVNLVGTVKRDATMRTDNKTNRQYLSFVMTVNIPDGKGKGRDMEVLVNCTMPIRMTFHSMWRNEGLWHKAVLPSVERAMITSSI